MTHEHKLHKEQLDKIAQLKGEELQNFVVNALIELHGDSAPIPVPTPTPGDCGPNPDPNNVHVKEGGWGGDIAGATTWDAIVMKDDPSLWKVVDKAGKNIAHKFASEAEAETYIKYHQCMQEKGDPDPDPIPNPDPDPTPVPVPGNYPYPAIGAPMQSTQRGPTTRHYASGKSDDETIEKNVKNIKFKNYQFVSYVTMNEIEHSDTLSTKLGGTHMGSGWFDHGISFGDGKGQCCLGTEKKHPSTQLCVIKGPNLGEIVGKKVGVAATYFKDINHTEFWVDLGTGWKKQVEGKDVNNFNPKSEINEAQLRIDGFKKGSIPTIHSSVVTEIAPKA